MAVDLRGVTAVLLPGTGSDDDYVYRAFAAALHEVGAVVVTPAAAAGPADRRLRVRAGQRRAAERRSPSAGCPSAPPWRSTGRWPIPSRAVAVLAALPPWTGSPETAPAALAAQALGGGAAPRRAGVGDLADAGIQPAVAGRRADPVVGRAMAVAARRHGGGVADTSRRRCAELEAAGRPDGRGRRDRRPCASAGGRRWSGWPPRRSAALRTVTLDEMGADPSVLGAACVAALPI